MMDPQRQKPGKMRWCRLYLWQLFEQLPCVWHWRIGQAPALWAGLLCIFSAHVSRQNLFLISPVTFGDFCLGPDGSCHSVSAGCQWAASAAQPMAKPAVCGVSDPSQGVTQGSPAWECPQDRAGMFLWLYSVVVRNVEHTNHIPVWEVLCTQVLNPTDRQTSLSPGKGLVLRAAGETGELFLKGDTWMCGPLTSTHKDMWPVLDTAPE